MATSGSIAKLFYVMPMFRYEKPEAGRLRQHHQYGVEWLGERSPYVDASVISLLVYFYGLLGIRGVRVILNSLGCSSCRVRYVEELSSYLEKLSESLCSDCRMRMIKNPLRALDCKNDHCQEVLLGAPKVIDFLCSDCLDDFRSVCRLLELEAVEFEIKPTLVRGLDYYSNTVFEVVADGSLEKEVIAGGGRYDSLMEEIGGVESHAFGFGAGMERLLSLIEKQGIILPMKSKSKVGVVSLCEKANDFVFRFSQILRKEKIACESFFNVRKVGKILSNLSEAGYCGAILVGDNEIEGRTVSVRRFDSRDQISVDFDNLMGVIEFLGI
jgi:histidyl-tRNA synthetase